MEQPSRREVLVRGAALAAATGCAGGTMKSTVQAGERDGVLRGLLDVNRTRHPRYRGGLANHLSMALCAQHALGATSEQLEQFASHYSPQLDPMPASGPAVDPKRWKDALGHDDALYGFVSFFEKELRERGRAAVLRDALIVLTPSLGSAAFHCLIRTAFGVRFEDDAEIAHGLAYWAITAEALGPLKKVEAREIEVSALLERIRADDVLAKASISGGSISGRMQQASKLEGFAEVASALDVDEKTLDRLAKEMLALFASTGNFTALHAVTATHALGVLLPFVADRELLLRHHWQALAAAFIGIGAPRAKTDFSKDVPAWSAIATRAVASSDDHDAKLVFACREENDARGDDTYRFAAALRVKL